MAKAAQFDRRRRSTCSASLHAALADLLAQLMPDEGPRQVLGDFLIQLRVEAALDFADRTAVTRARQLERALDRGRPVPTR